MKARYHLPPDAQARLRMLSQLAVAPPTTSLQPAMGPIEDSDSLDKHAATGTVQVNRAAHAARQ